MRGVKIMKKGKRANMRDKMLSRSLDDIVEEDAANYGVSVNMIKSEVLCFIEALERVHMHNAEINNAFISRIRK